MEGGSRRCAVAAQFGVALSSGQDGGSNRVSGSERPRNHGQRSVMIAAADHLHVLSLIPGRMRLHLQGWTAEETGAVEASLQRVKGVQRVQANPLTGNVLIHFDRRVIDEYRLRASLQTAWVGRLDALPVKPTTGDGSRRPVEGREETHSSWVRVGVRGVLGHAAIDSLWFAAGFLGQSLGLPLAGLGPLHVVMDLAVWGMALRSGTLRHPWNTRRQDHTGHIRRSPAELAGHPSSFDR
jgi:copper chaperone CopZ